MCSSEASALLATGGSGLGLGVGAGETSGTEVLGGFTCLGSSKEESVRASRGLEHELVQSHALSTGLDDSGASRLGETEGSDVDLGALKESLIVSDGSNDHNSAVTTVQTRVSNLFLTPWHRGA